MSSDGASDVGSQKNLDDLLDTSSDDDDDDDDDDDETESGDESDDDEDDSDDEEYVEVVRPSKAAASANTAKKVSAATTGAATASPKKNPPKKHLPKKHLPQAATITPTPAPAPALTPPGPDDDPEVIKRWEQLQSEFLTYSNWRLLPNGNCKKADAVESFRQHFPKYVSEDALPTAEIELLLQDWYHRKIRLTVVGGVYEGFHLNPKYVGTTGGSPTEITTPPVEPSSKPKSVVDNDKEPQTNTEKKGKTEKIHKEKKSTDIGDDAEEKISDNETEDEEEEEEKISDKEVKERNKSGNETKEKKSKKKSKDKEKDREKSKEKSEKKEKEK